MAVDLCTETTLWPTSPRISFSQDLIQPHETATDRSDSSLLDYSPDFHFRICPSTDHESSSADQLFSNGKILPHQFKTTHPMLSPQPRVAAPQRQIKESLREVMKKTDSSDKAHSVDKPESIQKPVPSKSFWRFRRSSSLNNGQGQKPSSFWSLPLLLRSNSMGSANHSPKHSQFKDGLKATWPKNSNFRQFPASPSTSPSSLSSSSPWQRTPSRKNSFGSNRNGSYATAVRISPVLNLPPPHISKGTVGLFGFGYFFGNRKTKKIKKNPFSPNAL